MKTEQLFDLVAPIAICGGADVRYEKKACAAWRKIRKLDPAVWTAAGCPAPPVEIRDIKDSDNFSEVYDGFAMDAYTALFEAIVEEHGPAELEAGFDYWGARGYKLPHQGSKNFELAGDSSWKYPWYEAAADLIERVKEIKVRR